MPHGLTHIQESPKRSPGPGPGRRRWPWSIPELAAGIAALLAAVALAVWEGTVSRSSAGARWSVAALIACALLTALVAGRRRQRKRSWVWARDGASGLRTLLSAQHAARDRWPVVVGIVVWVILAAATIGWDLNSFAHELHSLPTLSRLVGDVTRHDWGRSLVFGGWLVLGGLFAVGARVEDEPR